MAARPDPPRRPPRWGEPRPPLLARLIDQARSALGIRRRPAPAGLPQLPLALRRGELAEAYLDAERSSDHRRAAAAAASASEQAVSSEEWWPADLWAHRALWHFERVGMTLAAARQARRIGDLRSAAGDIGAEHEQGLAALGMGRSLLDLGEVTQARRLAGAAIELLDRSGAPAEEIGAARALLGTEVAVGERAKEER